MLSRLYITKKLPLAPILFTAFALISGFLLFSHYSSASVPVHFLESQPIHCSERDENCKKELKYDPAARSKIRDELKKLVDRAEKAALKTTFKPHPAGDDVKVDDVAGIGYVENYERFLRYQLYIRGGEFINNVEKLNQIAEDDALKKYVDDKLTDPDKLTPLLAPDPAYDVQVDMDKFYRGDEMGWDEFLTVATNPRRNFYGLSFLLEDARIEKQETLAEALTQQIADNRGYVGQRQFWWNCEQGEPGDENAMCWREYETLKPGATVALQLEKSITFDYDWALTSDEGVSDDGDIASTEQIVPEDETETAEYTEAKSIFDLE